MVINLKIKQFIIIIITIFIINYTFANDQTTLKLSPFIRIFKTLTWDQIIQKVHTPIEICSAVKHHVKYHKDVIDEWASGEETWNKKYGDCEDIAVTISELCTIKNIQTEIFIIYPENDLEGHAIVVGRWKSKLWFSSNGWFKYASSGAEIKRKIAHEMRWKQKNIIAMDWDSFRGLNNSITLAAKTQKIYLPIIN